MEHAVLQVAVREEKSVPSVLTLQDVELIPVLKLEPFNFAARARPMPAGYRWDMPEEWHRYWLASLADSGITGLMPLKKNSWHVPTSEFTNPAPLGKLLEVIFRNLSDKESPP